MIYKFLIELELIDKMKSVNVSSILHGIIMELLPKALADSLHTDNSYNPLKQRLIINDDNYCWEIISFSEELGIEIDRILKNNDMFFSKYHNENIIIKNYNCDIIDVNLILNKHLNNPNPKRIYNIKILTPTSFKSNGEYEIFLDLRKMFRSIMLNFDEFYKDYELCDEETLDYIDNGLKILDYKLRSTRFCLEGVKIKSFIGSFILKINTPIQMTRFVNFLLEYGTYSGFGIKTSLGMGKYIIE